jgi:hypothetical protein
MTARITTQKLGSSRVSLPRAGFGALMVVTLMAGSLIGAAGYAVIGEAIAHPATVTVTVPRESTVVRDLRIAAARGQLIGETEAATVTVTVPRESTVVRDLRIAAARGQLIGETEVATVTDVTTTTVITHAPGRGPLR